MLGAQESLVIHLSKFFRCTSAADQKVTQLGQLKVNKRLAVILATSVRYNNT